jgi:ferredoxin--NADP+ reductase
VLRFCASPLRLLGDEHVGAVEIGRNSLRRDADGRIRAVPTGDAEIVEAGLVIAAVGYTGRPVDGLPFDDGRGVLPQDGHGRITTIAGRPLSGAYVAGWIKRGPSGVIGTNKKCAQQTVDALLADAEAGRLVGRGADAPPDAGAVEDVLRARVGSLVTYAGWEAIDAHERRAGAPQGRPRVKLSRREELLAAAGVV